MKTVLIAVALTALASSCGSSDEAPRAIVSAPDDESTVPESGSPLMSLSETADPNREAVTWIEIDVDGTNLRFAIVEPVDLSPGATAPLLLAFPQGQQDERLVKVGLDNYWLEQASRRGWVVVSPVAPDGVLFFQGSEAVLGGLIEFVTERHPAEGARAHVAGISNGGVSSFRFAAVYPELSASITVLPGFPSNNADRQVLERLEVPIAMWAGESDTRWVEEMLDLDGFLSPLGRDITTTVVAGEGHILPGTSEFIAEIWSTLESARSR